MFLIHRPSEREITDFLNRSRNLPLSYSSVGIAQQNPSDFRIDEASAVIGYGKSLFDRAKDALMNWRHFDLGWVQLFPPHAPIEPGAVVAVVVHHLGFWSINACRVVYLLGEQSSASFGFAYGTLRDHAECGEELFEILFDPETNKVTYRIRAVSKPHLALAWLGYPLTRALQARFRRDSIAAIKRASEGI